MRKTRRRFLRRGPPTGFVLSIVFALSAVFVLFVSVAVFAGNPKWETGSPETLGFDRAKLDAARDALAARRTKNFLVVRRGQIAYEWYAEDSGPDQRHYTASLAKALVGGMSLLVAMDDGLINPDERAAKYIPAWKPDWGKNDPQKAKITIRHLATHSSGVENAEQDDIPHMELPGWKGAFWRQDPDPFTPAIYQAPVIFPPGAKYDYSNTGMAALAYAVTASLKGAPQTDILTLLKERIMEPIGATQEEWSIGYGQAFEIDNLKLYANWGGGGYTARAVARVGQLMLQRGEWNGRQLVNPTSVDQVTAYAGTPLPERPPGNPQPGSGLGWYTNFDGVWAHVPRDAFAGAGAQQQVLLVVPSLDMVIVRNGGALTEESESLGFWGGIEKYVFNPVVEAVVE